MNIENEMLNKCKNIIKNTIIDNSANPFLFITEADLKSYIYSQLFKENIFRKEYKDIDSEMILLHTEYYYKKKEIGYGYKKRTKYGHYDLVIIDPNRINETYEIDRKSILIGFELKLKYQVEWENVLNPP